MEDFLNVRTLELVNPGMMIVLTLALPDGVLYSETTLGMGYEIFGSCLVDMANTVRPWNNNSFSYAKLLHP